MFPHRSSIARLFVSLAALLLLAGCGDSGGGGGSGTSASTSWVKHWNQVAIDASGLDHTPVAPGENRVFGEQLGPGRASRAMAIVHIAVFDAIAAIKGGYEPYTGLPRVRGAASLKAAIAQAAHDTLAALFPSQAPTFAAYLATDLARIRDGRAKQRGIAAGRDAAARILAMRTGDGADHAEPLYGIDYLPGGALGEWSQDPISLHPLALGGHWGEVAPFVLDSTDQFRAPPPPAIDSAEYAEAYAEAQSVGGDGVVTPTVRTADETHAGIFWAYDGTPSLCAPPRLYNQIAVQLAEQRGVRDVVRLARMLALVNVAMADAGTTIWESKYHYKYWRPVVAIRTDDGNPDTAIDAAFTPLGAPASNLTDPNFTPPFPAYPSGHAGFGGALFQILRRYYGTDAIAFTFVSDEFNGVTRDNQGNVRPYLPRNFASLSAAEEENGQSRIYLGIHWAFDKTEGILQGNRVADYVYDHLYTKKKR